MDKTDSTTLDLEASLDAVSNMTAMIWFEPNGTILDANEYFCKALGYRLDEVVGQHHRMFVAKEYARSTEYQEFWKRLGAGASIVDEFTRYRKDGTAVHIAGGYHAIRDASGRTTKILKVALDMTAQKTKQNQIMRAVSTAAEFIGIEVDAITQTSNELSKRTENQAATVEETSAAMEEISATVNSNVANAERATSEAKAAKEHAEKGSAVVENAIAAMTKIENGSKEIRKFIEVIDSIAFQTNLLALNAGVEAARAGDAGRGFAVVASEVRALAQRASESAKDINALVDNSTREVEEGARLVNETGEVLTQIMEGVSKVSDGIESIYTASREQAAGVQEVNQSISNIDKDTQRNANMSQQNAESAANLARSATELANAIGGGAKPAQSDLPTRHATSVNAKPLAPPTRPAEAPRARLATQAATKPQTPAKVTAEPMQSAQKVAVNAPVITHDPDEDSWTEF